MDCSMPEVDGFDATRQIRQEEQANPAIPSRHIPIIALTANAINGDRERCLEAGMDDYVSKPIDPTRLMQAIQTLLSRSSAAAPAPVPNEVEAQPMIEAVDAPVPAASVSANDPSPPLAIEDLLDRCMGDAATVSLILDEFEKQAATDLVELRRCVESGDCTGTARVAHGLKGASGILSARDLCDIAFELERMGRAGALVDEGKLLMRLTEEVRRCIDFLPTARAAIASKAGV
jgi:HPt (histidine-containing phosphotransfer) domain-containing protein